VNLQVDRFQGLNASDLEGVKITIFGKDGARHDTMETHTCRYTRIARHYLLRCVEILLMAAEQWKASGSNGKSNEAQRREPQDPPSRTEDGTQGTMKIEPYHED